MPLLEDAELMNSNTKPIGMDSPDSINPDNTAQAPAGSSVTPDTSTPVTYADPAPDPTPNYSDATEGQTGGIDGSGTTVEDLYPVAPDAVVADPGTVATPTGANVVTADAAAGNVGTTGDATLGGANAAAGADASQTSLTAEQQTDAELARILGQDSPLLAQARAQAAQQANQRGLLNTSMAVGMSQDAMVKAATPLAQQNAQQAFQREMENTENRQEAEMFTAQQQNQLNELQAQLGTDISMFNVEQLNEGMRLQAELQTAIEQGNAAAANDAALQLAELARSAQEQQADLDYQSSAEAAAAQNALNDRVMQGVTALNEQYLTNLGAVDLAMINQTYAQLMSVNTTAASVYSAYISAMGNVMADPKMSPAEIANAVKVLQTTLEASMRMINEINGIGEDGAINLPTGTTDPGVIGGDGIDDGAPQPPPSDTNTTPPGDGGITDGNK